MGVVPNARKKVPYKLPENKTRSVFRTQSHKKVGYNEITFEDSTGLEQIHIRAERDMNTIVQRDKTKFVRGDEISRNIGNKISQVAGNVTTEISGFSVNRISGNYNISVGGKVPVSDTNTKQKHAWGVPEILKLTSFYNVHQQAEDSGNMSISTEDNISTYSRGHTKIESEMATVISSGDEIVIDSADNMTIFSRENITIATPKTILINSDEKIVLKCGNSTIEITNDKIKIKSPRVEIN